MRMLNLIGSRKKGRHPKWKDSHEHEQKWGGVTCTVFQIITITTLIHLLYARLGQGWELRT